MLSSSFSDDRPYIQFRDFQGEKLFEQKTLILIVENDYFCSKPREHSFLHDLDVRTCQCPPASRSMKNKDQIIDFMSDSFVATADQTEALPVVLNKPKAVLVSLSPRKLPDMTAAIVERHAA